ncbi:MAG: glycoside hydrolase family 9 protein [Verrucomicrobiota bacterium]
MKRLLALSKGNCSILLIAIVTFALTINCLGKQMHKHAPKGNALAIEAGLIHGMIDIEMIRPDLLSVTVDGGIVPGGLLANGGSELGAMPEEIQKPEGFSIQCDDDPNYKSKTHPIAVDRASYEWFNSLDAKNKWPMIAAGNVLRHDYYLKLPKPLASGNIYTVDVVGAKVDARFTKKLEFHYDEAKTTTKAIKINQTSYAATASERYAYLGWWAGSAGTVDFSDYKTFQVIQDSDETRVLEGAITERSLNHELSGEDIYQMDLSKLEPGSYRILVPGLGSSEVFHVSGDPIFERFYHAARAFFHQRCGQELRPPWTAITREATHVQIHRDGAFTSESDTTLNGAHMHATFRPITPEDNDVKTFRGGYHDAADFDTFAYHLPATAKLIMIYELYPEVFKDNQLNLPESGNGIPDVIDEALFGIHFHLEYQLPSGAVPLGRVNQCDARHQNLEGGKKGAPMPPYGILPPARASTPTFAAAAAQLARVVQPFDEKKADRLLKAARKAFDYASERTPKQVWEEHTTEEFPLVYHKKQEDLWIPRLVWAAGELLKTTGEQRYNDYIVANHKKAIYWDDFALPLWPYLQADAADPELQKEFREQLLRNNAFGADKFVRKTSEGGYRMSNGDGTHVGWGRAQGINNAEVLILAYALTKEKKYLDAVSFNADWHCGTNPISQTFMTSTGYRFPDRPEISYFLYKNRIDDDPLDNAVIGIGIYGFGPPMRTYPGLPKNVDEEKRWPLWRSWRDVWGNRAEIYSEFTINQTVGPAAMTYAFLYAEDLKAQAVSPDATAKFPTGFRPQKTVNSSENSFASGL